MLIKKAKFTYLVWLARNKTNKKTRLRKRFTDEIKINVSQAMTHEVKNEIDLVAKVTNFPSFPFILLRILE